MDSSISSGLSPLRTSKEIHYCCSVNEDESLNYLWRAHVHSIKV